MGASAAQALRPGELDPSFGHHGLVITSFGRTNAAANTIAVQGDGKIDVAGYAGGRVALVRYTGPGKLDKTFGVGGRVRPKLSGDAEALALAIQPDGKLLVAGWRFFPLPREFLVARFQPNGSLDTSFGSHGYIAGSFGSPLTLADTIQVQPDGKIVVAGLSQPNWFVLRLLPNGTGDPSFGANGLVTGQFDNPNGSPNDTSIATALALQPGVGSSSEDSRSPTTHPGRCRCTTTDLRSRASRPTVPLTRPSAPTGRSSRTRAGVACSTTSRSNETVT